MMANGFDFTGTVSMSVSGDASFGWGVIMIVLLLVALFMAVVWWRIFSKANLPGWGSLVPIYNAYLFFKLEGRPGWIFFLLLLLFCVLWLSLGLREILERENDLLSECGSFQ